MPLLRQTTLPSPLTKLLFVFFGLMLYSLSTEAQPGADFELAHTNGLRIRIYSQLTPVQINQMHSWELEVVNAQGMQIDDAEIIVVGGMPDHDHGLPTNPQVTGMLPNGRYLLEGIRFHMPGRWLMQFSVRADSTLSELELEFNL